MRLDKYLSDMGIASRSDLKKDIRKGLVFVNGEMIRDASFTVNSDSRTLYKGEEIRSKLLTKVYDERGWAIREDKEFKCDLYSDEFGDFIFSRITFTVWDYPVEPEILKEE